MTEPEITANFFEWTPFPHKPAEWVCRIEGEGFEPREYVNLYDLEDTLNAIRREFRERLEDEDEAERRERNSAQEDRR